MTDSQEPSPPRATAAPTVPTTMPAPLAEIVAAIVDATPRKKPAEMKVSNERRGFLSRLWHG
jgi:hypothetical protein